MKAIVRPTPTLQGEINALSSKNYTTRYMLIGALAGLYPAIRAARLAPTEALATP